MEIEGFHLLDNSDEITEELQELSLIALEKIGLQCTNYAKLEIENAPRRVDTGLLRNSIAYAVSGNVPSTGAYRGGSKKQRTYHADKADGKGEIKQGKYDKKVPSNKNRAKAVYVGTNVEYAAYVHEGHRTPKGNTVPPNRFLKNAIEKHKDEYKQILRETLQSGG